MRCGHRVSVGVCARFPVARTWEQGQVALRAPGRLGGVGLSLDGPHMYRYRYRTRVTARLEVRARSLRNRSWAFTTDTG